ncbi:Signal transduction histidine kinase [Prauserella aidingensis]|uniref:sensor histidine kinase n=1 Tax=Prauserella aidingensis TaxID=387890 RepID=UPI0020A5D41E|nr:nitrate- and nitrite sensing domain-containing protein [Prauserella aidingensis]MCP2252451.1 Signal transduction histidine kinase [Prauserella aidingensis]
MPVGQLLGEDAPKPSPWKALARWRDWKLPAKLGAVTLIPIVIALVLGGLTLATQLDRADRYDRVAELAQLNSASRTLLDALQRERTATAAALTRGNGADSEQLNALRDEVDRAVGPVRAALATEGADLEALAEPRAGLNEQLDRLSALRERVSTGQLGAIQATQSYSVITSALLTVDVAAVSGMGDRAVGGTPTTLHDILVAREEVSIQQALVAHGIDRGGLAPSEFDQLRTSAVRLDDRLTEFRSTATVGQRAAFNETVRGEAFDSRERIMRGLLAGQDGDAAFGDIRPAQWRDASDGVFTSTGQFSDRLGTEVTTDADDAAGGAHAAVLWLAVLFVLALALAAVVVFVITRQLLRSLNVLRTAALDVADRALPEAVRSIQDGQSQNPVVRPVPVSTDDEIGQVARAFDAVHNQALRLAVEQAGMRAGFAAVFVNLSRRSQSLVQRQLQLIERLERDEEDADQLATLFQLDHLATRMRRNNENLMVLSGDEPGRRSGRPVSATDVLRAAVSEIEQYQRVVVNTPPSARVVGYAAGDLVRLVAELLDNATAFSAPETRVTLSSRLLDDGSLQVDISDRGIGMNDAELEEANGRLRDVGPVDIATSRRMGLFVVGRLAERHGFGVALQSGPASTGVTAVVTVPSEVVIVEQHAPTEVLAQAGPATLPGSAARPTGAPGAAGATATSGTAASGTAAVNGTAGAVNGTGAANGTGAVNGSAAGTAPAAGGGSATTSSGLPQRRASGSAAAGSFAPLTRGGDAPSETEVSGTALFNPVTGGDQGSGGTNGTGAAGTGDGDATGSTPAGGGRNGGSGADGGLPIPHQGGPADDPGTQNGDAAASEGTDSDTESDARSAKPELPRRKPGASRTSRDGASRADGSAGGAADADGASNRDGVSNGDGDANAAPAQSSDLGGSALFAVPDTEVTDWWNAATSAKEPPAPEPTPQRQDGSEGTPIFNDMLSAWFRASDADEDQGWGSSANPHRSAAGNAGGGEPAGYTPAGLPRRERGRKLMPGSASDGAAGRGVNGVSHEQAAPAKPPQRDPSDVRSRLSSFQHGVSRGKRRQNPEDESDATAVAGGATSATPATGVAGAASPDAAAAPGGESSGAGASGGEAPGGETAPAETAGVETARTESPGAGPSGTAEPEAAPTSEGSPAQETPAQETPVQDSPAAETPGQDSPVQGASARDTDRTASGGRGPQPRRSGADAPTTAAGLPQRQRKPRPAPAPSPQPRVNGTAVHGSSPGGERTDAAAPAPEQAAADTATAEPATTGDATGETSSAPAGSGVAQSAAAEAGVAEAATAEVQEESASGTSEWMFATDDSGQVGEASPTGYTPAGLPRRQRGEQLMPGSATSTGPAGGRPRRERDPADVQGRLSSFQQGIRRGRHRTARASDSSEQKVEGE